MDDVRTIVRRFIQDDIVSGGGEGASFADDAPLRASGILDSLSQLKLVAFLEDRFGLRLEAADLHAGQLASLLDIERFVRSRTTLQT